MRYELTDYEWAAVRSMLPNKPRGAPRVDDRCFPQWHLFGCYSVARWRDLPQSFGP